MLVDFYITRHSNDMKIAVQKNHLVGKIWYRTLVPPIKNGVLMIYSDNFFVYVFVYLSVWNFYLSPFENNIFN